jgi:hypothetical protein
MATSAQPQPVASSRATGVLAATCIANTCVCGDLTSPLV